MKRVLIIAAAIVIVPSLSMVGSADAYRVQAKKRQDAKQLMSHQMHQPPPGSGKRYKMSQERLEEIRQLFLEAENDRKKKPAK